MLEWPKSDKAVTPLVRHILDTETFISDLQEKQEKSVKKKLQLLPYFLFCATTAFSNEQN